MELEDLPSPLLIDILSRVTDAGDLAAARLSSRTLRSLSRAVSSVAIRCSHHRFLRSRHPATRHLVLPFKTLVLNNLSLLNSTLLDLSIGIEKPFAAAEGEDGSMVAAEEEELGDSDDLHLTAVDFVVGWVEIVGGRLRSLEISDYWIQSCWRRSEALAIISHGCGSLLDLVVRNAWLSVEGLKTMPKLTKLTLEFIRLDDEHLDMVNECFPSLQVLNLIGVGGLKEPKINLPQLKVCHWIVSDFPLSLAIHAPNLTELKLHCVEPKILVLETPLLSHLDLKIRKPVKVTLVGKLQNLKFVSLESSYLCSLTCLLRNKSVEKLELEVPQYVESDELSEPVSIVNLASAFPNVHDLTLGPGACAKLEKSFNCKGVDGRESEWGNLKKLMVHLPLYYDFTFLSFMLNLCVPFSKVALLIHGDVHIPAQTHIISRCKSNFPDIIWKWGMWRESCKISWICEGEGDWPYSH